MNVRLQESADLHEWTTLQDALSSQSVLSGLQAGPMTRTAVSLLDSLAECTPTLLGWCRYVAGRLMVRSVELQHNVLSGFLHAREEALEAIPTLLGEMDGSADADDRSAAAAASTLSEAHLLTITRGLHLDISRAHACLQDLQVRPCSLSLSRQCLYRRDLLARPAPFLPLEGKFTPLVSHAHALGRRTATLRPSRRSQR